MLRKHLLTLAASAAALFALVSAVPPAQAQFGGYAMFTAERLSGLSDSPRRDPTVAYIDSTNPVGGTFGGFYDVRTIGPARLGVDARFSHTTDQRSAQRDKTSAGTHVYTTLAGIRASFHTPIQPLVPYAQVSAGLGRSDYGIVFATDASGRQKASTVNSLAYHAFVGVDYNLLPFLGLRVFEVGYGGLRDGHNYPIASVSTGLVLRFGTTR